MIREELTEEDCGLNSSCWISSVTNLKVIKETCSHITSAAYLPHTGNSRFDGNSGSVMQFIFQ